MLQITTANVRGLNDSNKRREMFTFFKKSKYDIICIQETHSDKNSQFIWEAQWGGKILFSHGETDARGVAIFFSPNLNVKICKSVLDENGRIVAADISVNDQKFLICNIYAPNEDKPNFFLEVFETVQKLQHADRIIAGDFNLVVKRNKDSLNRKANNDKALAVLELYMEQAMMTDCFRYKNPESFRFTWHRKKPQHIYARLDYIFVNFGLLTNVTRCEIKPAYKSDHAQVVLKLEKNNDEERGKGFWKLNSSLLESIDYVKELNLIIEKAKEEISDSPEDIQWEYVKSECVKYTQAFAKKKALEKSELFVKIKLRIEKMNKMCENEAITALERTYAETQLNEDTQVLNKHIEHIARGASIRSKTNWYVQGESNSKYFLGLEKVKASNKTLKAIICEDGSITRQQKKIIREQFKFYKKLYAKNPEIEFALKNETTQKLSQDQKQELDTPFTFEEFTQALKGMAKQKSPGSDGLSCEFYVVFWSRIGKLVWQAMQVSHKRGRLYKSARRGIISLIPKKDKNPMDIQGWRPLVLLNVDCKILTRMLALRLKTVISCIIGPQQTGYVPGRDISFNIRKLIDMLMYLEREEIPAVVLTVDFYKCFDSVNHDSLYKSMRYFNVGEYYISWIVTVYTDFELCVTNNGHRSEYFTQTAGVHQGCAFSGLGFLFCAEILAINIKNNKKIKPIPVNGNTEVISQYADDTSIITVFEQEAIQAVVDEFELFYRNTGLKVNYEKSTIFRVGAIRNSNAKIKTTKNFKWQNGTIDVLGILIEINSLNELEDSNYGKVLEKAAAIIKSWSARRLTILGKTQVVNSLIGSLFVYRMQVLPTISKTLEAKLKQLLSDFIWCAKKPKIRMNTLTVSKEQGGCRLVDLKKRDMSLKVQSIKKIYANDPMLASLAYYHINTGIKNELFWQCNFAPRDIKQFKCKSTYWQDVLGAWASFNHSTPETPEQIANEIIWYNSHITVDKKIVFCEKWYQKGIIYIKDLYVQNHVMSLVEFQDIWGSTEDVMTYNSIVSAIPTQWKRKMSTMESDVNEAEWQSKYEYLQSKEKWSSHVYSCLIDTQVVLNETVEKQIKICHSNIPTERVKQAFKKCYTTTKIIKYRSFQYRLLHNAILLNNRLSHMGITQTPLCSFCKTEIETIKHFFVECKITKKIWNDINKYLKQVHDTQIEINAPTIILNDCEDGDIYDIRHLYILITKQFLYREKCMQKKPNAASVIAEIEFIHKIEKQEAITKRNSKAYNKRWPDKLNFESDIIQEHIENITM